MVGRSLVAILALGLAAAGCSDDEGEGDGIRREPVLEISGSPVGTCLRVTDDLPPEVTELPVVPCDAAHTHEIYGAVIYREQDVFPGMDRLEAFAERECIRAFEPYVGVSPFDSSLFFSWLVPSLDSWNADDDREVLCVLGDHAGSTLTRSMQGARL